MAFKEVSGQATDIKKTPNQPYVGYYTGKRTIQTKIGEQTIWSFVDDNDKPFGVYGFTSINRLMETVKENTLCRITYLGQQEKETKFGRKQVHQAKLEIDDSPNTPIAA